MDGLSPMRLNVSSIGTAQLASTQTWRTRSHPGMDAAATTLGMSADDLRTALQSGQSLASIASSKGVSQDTLIASMATAIQQANPNAFADQATKVATAIATRTPGSGGIPTATPADGSLGAAATQTGGTTATGGHHHHRHHVMSTAMDAAAKTLGTTTSDLMTALQNGQSLASIASSKGVSKDDLVPAISGALTQADSNLTADQASQMATALVTGTPASEGQSWTSGSQAPASTFNVLA